MVFCGFKAARGKILTTLPYSPGSRFLGRTSIDLAALKQCIPVLDRGPGGFTAEEIAQLAVYRKYFSVKIDGHEVWAHPYAFARTPNGLFKRTLVCVGGEKRGSPFHPALAYHRPVLFCDRPPPNPAAIRRLLREVYIGIPADAVYTYAPLKWLNQDGQLDQNLLAESLDALPSNCRTRQRPDARRYVCGYLFDAIDETEFPDPLGLRYDTHYQLFARHRQSMALYAAAKRHSFALLDIPLRDTPDGESLSAHCADELKLITIHTRNVAVEREDGVLNVQYRDYVSSDVYRVFHKLFSLLDRKETFFMSVSALAVQTKEAHHDYEADNVYLHSEALHIDEMIEILEQPRGDDQKILFVGVKMETDKNPFRASVFSDIVDMLIEYVLVGNAELVREVPPMETTENVFFWPQFHASAWRANEQARLTKYPAEIQSLDYTRATSGEDTPEGAVWYNKIVMVVELPEEAKALGFRQPTGPIAPAMHVLRVQDTTFGRFKLRLMESAPYSIMGSGAGCLHKMKRLHPENTAFVLKLCDQGDPRNSDQIHELVQPRTHLVREALFQTADDITPDHTHNFHFFCDDSVRLAMMVAAATGARQLHFHTSLSRDEVGYACEDFARQKMARNVTQCVFNVYRTGRVVE